MQHIVSTTSCTRNAQAFNADGAALCQKSNQCERQQTHYVKMNLQLINSLKVTKQCILALLKVERLTNLSWGMFYHPCHIHSGKFGKDSKT
jgi:hypothetical protein